MTGITASLSEPDALAGDALSKHFNTYPKGDWRYSESLQESLDDVKAAKLDDAKKFYQQFYGASPAEIAIVGDFDEASVTALLKELFGDWKPIVPYERVPLDYKDVPPVKETILTPDKENAIFLARENLEMRDDDADFPALYMADYIFGGGAGFDSRLTARIRQKEGLSYSVGSGLSVDSEDNAASWSVYAIAAPQNVAKLESAFHEEIDRALRDGFTDAGARFGEIRDPAIARPESRPGRNARRRMGREHAHRAHLPVEQGFRGENPGAHAGRGERGFPEVHRSEEAHDRHGGGFREEVIPWCNRA